MTTRRVFLSLATSVTAAAVLGHSMPPQGETASEAKLAADPMRPQFHLMPAANWMNDPNGPIWFNRRYHMFCQYNPHAAVWGDMSWAHAVSPDMMHWTHLPVAMTPTPGGPDAYGVFTGSCFAVDRRVYAIYTGTVQSTPEKATLHDEHSTIRESQCLAYSDDPELIHWTKLPEPVIAAPPAGMNVTGFRDPSIWKQDGWYYMTVGSGMVKQGGCVLLYRSRDLKHWTWLHKLTGRKRRIRWRRARCGSARSSLRWMAAMY
ncbi:glycoside hydrolase family 32 protein [Paracidobacterium acidisoli]|uniref:glycoside hydrolase family 32 protein n=1 Tax=Paracidobacterium acidisoli TaxID=2303751 RepID=UPI001313DACD|nr:glycoside hydrolase family 32 protein [Paracidobacterium acidisoli]MBT9332677.1 glycoside hydrolase family 32 protein [Paracidobacterium acidisoli]